MKFIILLLIFSHSLFAAGPYDLTKEEINPETEEVLIKKPEKYLRNESMIYDLNTNIGIKDQRTYTGTDKNRLSLSGHVSGDYEQFSDILGADFSYMRRTERYNRVWYGLQVFQNQTYFDSITQNQTPRVGDNANDESQTQRPNNTKASVLAGGFGMGYRFKLLLDFFPTENVFENIDVFANYVMMDEKFTGQKYSGFGLTTNYGIHKRSGGSFFYGGKISYNLASVTRSAIAEESKSSRSFALGWLSMGLELGMFF